MSNTTSKENEFANLRVIRWSGNLQKHLEDFGKEVLELRNLDKTVIANRYILGHLQTQIAASFADHCRVSRQLDILELSQVELDSVLESLGGDLRKAESSFMTTGNEREQLFSFGEDISFKLQAITQSLPRVATAIYQSENSEALSLGPMFHMLRSHLRELQQLEREILALAKKG